MLLCLKQKLCLEIGCKGTTFCAHNQIKCTKSASLCTKARKCASFFFLFFMAFNEKMCNFATLLRIKLQTR